MAGRGLRGDRILWVLRDPLRPAGHRSFDEFSTRAPRLLDTRACDGLSPRFDEDRIRQFITSDVDRADDIAATISNPPAMEFLHPRRGDLGTVSAPSLVMHGEMDSVFPVAHGEAVARLIPDAAFVVLPGAGHTLLTIDQADFTTPSSVTSVRPSAAASGGLVTSSTASPPSSASFRFLTSAPLDFDLD
ncbi:alpha/beta fold hydrolase [Cryobacterium sp. Hz9]|uniref:alpha/beta fold hydrolase n=1 Tax=Cryobacterium sp. Hz9 TaxID=1259167 RepID=UPI001F54597B|nr:alpha/beta hydrolase [Cryobacterium sp. Hz9]